jgi:hypothetical protein
MRTIKAIAAAAVLFLGLVSVASAQGAGGGAGGTAGSAAGTSSGAGGNPAGGGKTAVSGVHTPLTQGESVNPSTGVVVGQPLQPGDIGYKGHQ